MNKDMLWGIAIGAVIVLFVWPMIQSFLSGMSKPQQA